MMDALQRQRLFVASCAGMFMFGIVLALLGTLFGLPEMRERLQVNLAQQGDLFFLLYFGILLANLVAGPMIDRAGHRPVLLASSFFVTVALLGFAGAQSFLTAAMAALLLGVGGAGLNTAATALVSDLYEDARGSMLSYLGIFFGIGALFIPLLAASISVLFSVGQLLLFSAALAAACLVAYAVLRFPPARETGGFSLGEMIGVARNPGVLLFGVVLFCQSGNEAAIGGWTSTYLGTRGADPNTATWVLSGYWAGMMAGRGLSGYLMRRVNNSRMVLASALGALLGCVVLISASSVAVMAAGVAFTGLSFAAIFPGILAMAGDRYARFAGTVFGLLFSMAVVGGMIFPWAIGHLGQSFGVRSGLFLPIAGTAAIVLLINVISRRDATSRGEASGHR